MFPNAKNSNVLASKLRSVKTFKGGKCYFTGEVHYNSDTDGRAIYRVSQNSLNKLRTLIENKFLSTFSSMKKLRNMYSF